MFSYKELKSPITLKEFRAKELTVWNLATDTPDNKLGFSLQCCDAFLQHSNEGRSGLTNVMARCIICIFLYKACEVCGVLTGFSKLLHASTTPLSMQYAGTHVRGGTEQGDTVNSFETSNKEHRVLCECTHTYV